NTFLVDAAALAALDMPWTYFTVTKDVDGRPAIQFERLLGELTSGLDSRFVEVPRSGPHGRFIPAKDFDELEARRPEIAERLGPRLAAAWTLPAESLLEAAGWRRPQRGLGPAERRANVRGAFRAQPADARRIVLVDDVHTTGATLSAAAAALRRAGAEEVHA